MPPPHPQLKWHNTLPQHFSGHQSPKAMVTPSRRAEKRQIPSPDAMHLDDQPRLWSDGGDFNPPMDTNSPSPTKRHRTIGRSSSNLTTPVKSSIGSNGSGNLSSAGSGMQTPPPSNSSISKRRGRPPKMALGSETPQLAVISPLSSPSSKASRHIKQSSQATPTTTVDSRQVIDSTDNPVKATPPGSKEVSTGNDIHEDRSSFHDGDSSLEWPSFDEETGLPSSVESDLFLHSDIGYEDANDHMAFSFNFSDDFHSDSLPSIDPTLLFSSRPTSDASSIFGGYGDDTDVISSSSHTNEQPYQHQYDYSRREQALELQRSQRRRLRRQKVATSYPNSVAAAFQTGLRHSISENLLTGSTAASLDEAVKRQAVIHSLGRENGTPPPEKLTVPKTSIQLLVSPGGRARTEAKITYEDSETEVDETNAESGSFEESMESDSSLDDPTPRGLGPGGKPYTSMRKAKNTGFSPRGTAPKLGLFINSKSSVRQNRPITPPRGSMAKPVAGSASKSGINQTPRRPAGRFLDECILSSPKLPTPLQSSPGGFNRPKIIPPSNSISLSIDSRLHHRPVLDISDESEAETVVDETMADEDEGDDKENEREELEQAEGDAVHALRSMVAKRRGTRPAMEVIRTPSKSLPGSAEKRRYHSGKVRPNLSSSTLPSTSATLDVRKSLFPLPPGPSSSSIPSLPYPPKKPLRKRKVIPDGGYPPLKSDNPMASSVMMSFATVVDPPDLASTSSTEEEGDGNLENEDLIRCSCGMDKDGGTTMIQCDACHNWLHLKCTGLNRKQLPDTFKCHFCRAGGAISSLPTFPLPNNASLGMSMSSKADDKQFPPAPSPPPMRRFSSPIKRISSPVKRGPASEQVGRAGSPVKKRMV